MSVRLIRALFSRRAQLWRTQNWKEEKAMWAKGQSNEVNWVSGQSALTSLGEYVTTPLPYVYVVLDAAALNVHSCSFLK